MNVQVHRAVSDLTGETGMRIVRATMASERDPRKLVALRHMRCHKSEAEFVAYPTGTWWDEHLFNLQAALRLYDTKRASRTTSGSCWRSWRRCGRRSAAKSRCRRTRSRRRSSRCGRRGS